MKKTISILPDVSRVFEVLQQGGVVVLPSQLGYAILAMTVPAIETFYALKGRPLDKPSGILATPALFSETTDSEFTPDISKFRLPVGFIEVPKWDHPVIQSLPSFSSMNGAIGFFFNLTPFMTQLAEYAWRENCLITISSANKSGTGNSLEFEKLHSDFKRQAALVIEGDDLSWRKERGTFDKITSTIIDLTQKKLIRNGVFADRIKARAIELNMIRDHLEVLPARDLQTPGFTSCIFLLAHKAFIYKKIKALRAYDWVVLDLEDSCPPDKKASARTLIEQHAAEDTFASHFVAIRLNELSNSEELKKDLAINYTSKIYAFLLPMLQNEKDVKEYEDKISLLEKRLGLEQETFKFFPIIETIEGLSNAAAIAKASRRNIGMFLGHADLFGELAAERTPENLHYIRMHYLMAARLANIPAFDTPFEQVSNLAGLERDAIQGRAIGMDGKVALNFKQNEIINTVFNLNQDQHDTYKKYLEHYRGGCHMVDGKFLAPPIIKGLERQLQKNVYKPKPYQVRSTIGKTINYGLDYKKAHARQIVKSPYPTTIDESWITTWQALVQTGNPIEINHHYCLAIGLEGRLIPFQLLVNLSLCLLVESFSESSLFHLGISNAVYERPVYVGDTLNSFLLIDEIVPSSNKQFCIFKTRMVFVNQKEEVVLRMNRNSLFPYFVPAPTTASTFKENPAIKYFQQQPRLPFRTQLLAASDTILSLGFEEQAVFNTGDLILHSLVRPMGLSNSISFSTLYKNTHPLHINTARYGMDGLVVCGGFIIPIMHGAASRDIRFALDHEIIDTMHINKMHHEDSIGAMTYIIDVQKVNAHIECLTLRTFGLKNIDPEKDLKSVQIPNEILQSSKIKPREIEQLCQVFCPSLHQKICARMTWRMWRVVAS